MMKVTVEVNGRAIGEATATNRGHPGEGVSEYDDARVYELDDGSTLVHHRRAGAKGLAMRLIKHMEMEPEYVTVVSEPD